MQIKLTAVDAWLNNSPGKTKKLIVWFAAGIVGMIIIFAILSKWTYNSLPPIETDSVQHPGALSSVGLIASLVVKLGVVILLIYVSMLLIKRWQMSHMGMVSKNMCIIETTHLSPRQAIHLVKINQKVFLIGATDQSISTLGELDESITAELLSRQPTNSTFQGLNFSTLLSKSLQRR